MINIQEILDIRSIVVGLDVKDKNDLLDILVELAAESGNIQDIEEAKLRIVERERLMPTGVGNGIALPHAKTNKIIKTVASFAVLNEPVDYNAQDEEPVKLVLLILGKENNIGEHLKLLSKISKLLIKDSFVSELLLADTSDEIIEIFDKYDE